MSSEVAILSLHATFDQRDTPETVAELISRALPAHLANQLRAPIQARIATSVRRAFGWSSMPTVFRAPHARIVQFAKARELVEIFLQAPLPEGDDPEVVEQLLTELNALIGKRSGEASFRDDRLNRQARADFGLQLSRRRYDKLFRLIGRLEAKLAKLRVEEAKHRLLLIAKAGLAPELTVEQLGGNVTTAAFVAYYTARTKVRSEFTIQGQQKPFDALAAALLRLCEKEADTSWYAIAHVFPRSDVLARLSEEQKGELLGRWFTILSELAERLEASWRDTQIDLDTMIVRRGNDSSTWNLFAAAWNRARDHWIALVEALGLDALLDELLPGKVMRLMAADVAAWHRSTGGDIHPDTVVWRQLPRPWDVLRLEAFCDRSTIEKACASAGVDPVKSGWSAARPRTAIATFRPTPELVHGVSVSNPYMAVFLRRLGAFSGRPLRADVLRDLQEG
jgi:hypothetical protein